jgi:hypothetical protein
MDVKQTLLRIEHELADGRGAEYRRHLAEDAVVIVPSQALDKEATAQAMDSSPGWDELSIEDPRVIELGDGSAVLTYRFRGRRGSDFAYAALMSSAYRRSDGEWKLVLHQQTPLG